jgi:hypothetical protein
MSFSRRDFIALVGTSVAGAAVVGAAGRSVSATSSSSVAKKATDSWVVDSIGAVAKGAVPITLRHATTGERLSVEACRRGSGRQAVASSRDFDLFLVNNGQGHAQTPASHTLAVRSLAKHLDKTVKAVPSTVVTMASRQSKHAELYTTNDDPIA